MSGRSEIRAADWAWLTLAAGIVAYEAAATRREWELLSEAADRYRHRHPVVVHLLVAYLAGHLTRHWPQRADPLHRLAERISR